MLIDKPKILVVDDEESMVFSIEDYLNSYAECLGATSYAEAISILEREEGISLVISDIRMPDKDGFDLLMWLHTYCPQVKVIMITAYGSPSVRSLAKRRGAVMYLEKPLDLELLLQVVKQIVERKGFSLALTDIELTDVLQFLIFANKQVRVEVLNPLGEKGEFGLDGDEILWIRSGSKEGEEAFYDIMSWDSGTFEVLPLDNDTKSFEIEKLSVPLSYLLFEEARRRDEAAVSTWEEEAAEEEQVLQVLDNAAGIDLTKELTAWQTGVAGFVAAVLTHMDGTYIAGTSNLAGKDLSEPAAYCAKTVKAIVETLNSTKTGHYREVLITTDTHYVIWKKLTDEIFLSLTVTIDQGNLGMARLQMDQLGKRVIEELR
jgi:CheY-like chemotaxis protein/predicted regulator of Ras-like GTPase activity (Roadblock/LC7/MglB family)